MSFKFGSGETFDEWSRKLHTIMDQMHKRIFFEFRRTEAWRPRVNVYETRTHLHVCVELAGLQQDEVYAEAPDDRHVVLSGLRPRPAADLPNPYSVEMLEIDEGAFSREIELPEAVDTAQLEFTYDRGFLWLRLPKRTT